jgi:hypothetical protein
MFLFLSFLDWRMCCLSSIEDICYFILNIFFVLLHPNKHHTFLLQKGKIRIIGYVVWGHIPYISVGQLGMGYKGIFHTFLFDMSLLF